MRSLLFYGYALTLVLMFIPVMLLTGMALPTKIGFIDPVDGQDDYRVLYMGADAGDPLNDQWLTFREGRIEAYSLLLQHVSPNISSLLHANPSSPLAVKIFRFLNLAASYEALARYPVKIDRGPSGEIIKEGANSERFGHYYRACADQEAQRIYQMLMSPDSPCVGPVSVARTEIIELQYLNGQQLTPAQKVSSQERQLLQRARHETLQRMRQDMIDCAYRS